MKSSILVLMLLFLIIHATGQYETVSFETIDITTEKPISGVTVSPVFNGDTVYSNKKGLIKYKVPQGFHDSIILVSEDYYPYIIKKTKRAPGQSIPIFMTPNALALDTLCFIEDTMNRRVTGKVYHYYKGNLLDNVTIRMENNMIIGYTNSQGEYVIVIPRSADSLTCSLEGFRTIKTPIMNHRTIGLVPKNPGDSEIRRLHWNNVLSISPLELMRGGIGLRYERFVSKRHSVGLHGSYYFLNQTKDISIPLEVSDHDLVIIEEFDGIKLALFYRYYLRRTVRGGNYVEAKPMAGYFYFPELISYDHNPYYFWTAGIGGGWGIMSVQSNRHLTMNFSVGFQYFPMQDPRIDDEYQGNNGWWFALGPGSVIEIKFTLGGIF